MKRHRVPGDGVQVGPVRRNGMASDERLNVIVRRHPRRSVRRWHQERCRLIMTPSTTFDHISDHDPSVFAGLDFGRHGCGLLLIAAFHRDRDPSHRGISPNAHHVSEDIARSSIQTFRLGGLVVVPLHVSGSPRCDSVHCDSTHVRPDYTWQVFHSC